MSTTTPYPITRAMGPVSDFSYFCSTVTTCGDCCFECKDDLIKAYIDYRTTATQIVGPSLVGIGEARERGLPNMMLPGQYRGENSMQGLTLREFVGEKYGSTHDNFIMDTERTTDRADVIRKIKWLKKKLNGLEYPRWREQVCKTWLDDFITLYSFTRTEEGRRTHHLKSRLWMVCFGRYTLQDLAQGRSFVDYLLGFCQNLPSRPPSEAAGCLCLDRSWKTSEIAISDAVSKTLIDEGKHTLDDERTRAVCLALEHVEEPILEILLSQYPKMPRGTHSWLSWLQTPSLVDEFQRLWSYSSVQQGLGELRMWGNKRLRDEIRTVEADLRRLTFLARDPDPHMNGSTS